MVTEKYKVEKKFINAAKAHLLYVRKILFSVINLHLLVINSTLSRKFFLKKETRTNRLKLTEDIENVTDS